jgi:hypothetical protein
MSSLLPAYSRRLIPAAVIAAVAAFGATVLEQPTIGSAKTREWDVAAYDKCTDAADKLWGSGQITKGQWIVEYNKCCTASGGELNSSGTCVAPPLYPEPQGPAAPAPTAASQPPTAPVPPVAPLPTVIGPG